MEQGLRIASWQMEHQQQGHNRGVKMTLAGLPGPQCVLLFGQGLTCGSSQNILVALVLHLMVFNVSVLIVPFLYTRALRKERKTRRLGFFDGRATGGGLLAGACWWYTCSVGCCVTCCILRRFRLNGSSISNKNVSSCGLKLLQPSDGLATA